MEQFEFHVLVFAQHPAGIRPALFTVGHLGDIGLTQTAFLMQHLCRWTLEVLEFRLRDEGQKVHDISASFTCPPGDKRYFHVIDARMNTVFTFTIKPGNGVAQAPPLICQDIFRGVLPKSGVPGQP
jgi:hypothetical protein